MGSITQVGHGCAPVVFATEYAFSYLGVFSADVPLQFQIVSILIGVQSFAPTGA